RRGPPTSSTSRSSTVRSTVSAPSCGRQGRGCARCRAVTSATTRSGLSWARLSSWRTGSPGWPYERAPQRSEERRSNGHRAADFSSAATEGGGAMKFPFLASLVLTPAAGALVIALVPRGRPEIARVLSLLFSVVVAALSIATLVHFRRHAAAFQTVSQHRWIPDWGVSWQLGIDGISLFLVVLTGVLFPIAIAGRAV